MVNKNYNKKRYSELREYSCMLEAHLDWEGRAGYLKLLENFQKRKIEDFEFCFAFEERGLLMSDLSDILKSNLILLSPHEKSNHFSSFISAMIDICKSYIENADGNDEDSKIEFENLILEMYLQLQEILKEDPLSLKDSMDLSELVDQLNWESQDQYFELIEDFLDDSSNFLNFKERYQSIVQVAKEFESNSISLKINSQALGFSNYIQILIKFFDSYQIDSRISPKVFRYWVGKIFLEMKDYSA